VIWGLGKALVSLGHKVIYLVKEGSHCDFTDVLILRPEQPIEQQIPKDVDVVHFHSNPPKDGISQPYVSTLHGNTNAQTVLNKQTIFISQNHAARHGSEVFVHNGLDWSEYQKPDLSITRRWFHFLGKASWRLKNVVGAIDTVKKTKQERIHILGGTRLNFSMGFRWTLSPRARFHGTVGGAEKDTLLNQSKGLVFPVRWHEPFGLTIIESLYFGCPVFGTPYGSLPELVHNDVGILSASRDELTTAVEASSFSPQVCHEYAQEQFNSHRMAEEYLQYYDKVLQGDTLHNDTLRLVQTQTEKFLPWQP
jgi:glycosyltransferase involved in cell wall biosynthesis